MNYPEHQLENARRQIECLNAWLMNQEIEWLTHGDEQDTWTPCLIPPSHWDWLTFDFRVKQ